MIYEKPEAQIVLFDNSDVITASGECPDWPSKREDMGCSIMFLNVIFCSIGFLNQKSFRNSTNDAPAGPPKDPFANI